MKPLLFALFPTLAMLPFAAVAVGSVGSAPAGTRSQPADYSFVQPVCLFGSVDSPACAFHGLQSGEFAVMRSSTAGMFSLRTMTNDRLTRIFQSGYQSRTRAMDHCLDMKPAQPGFAYATDSTADGLTWHNRDKPYFSVVQDNDWLIQQDSYSAYMDCMANEL